MNITLNGEPHQTEATTLAALVLSLGLNIAKVAIERNRVLAPRSLHDEIALKEGDQIEIVQFVGGG